ncbi:MAG: TIGR02206 family membrane protein [Chthoniobacterales bacterium]|nr:TIGR02206 family membrane protein [Chthoniobacterales bacterium]
MNSQTPFHAYSVEHLTTILITLALPFVLAAAVRRSAAVQRVIIAAIAAVLVVNYLTYLVFVRRVGDIEWRQMLPMQMCDWAMVVVLVAVWTANHRWFEVAYFWGLGGTLQAVLTPNLHYGFPDPRFISFFVAHGGIIVGVVFLMLTRRLRPYPLSIVRVFAWSELYFVVTLVVDEITGVNYGFLLHKPEAFSLLSLLSDSRPLYSLQMHGLALLFFSALYMPFAIVDLIRKYRSPVVHQ